MENQPFLLVELVNLSSIFAPLKSLNRIKYTCFSVSKNYLIFGATSGGLYVFRREPCCFLQLLPNKEGSITQTAISPDEKLIAFSTVKGIVCVLNRSSHTAKHLVTTTEHLNAQITYLQWNDKSDELFVGDDSGKVSMVTVSAFPSKSMFQAPSFVLMQLDSKIVQMDFNSNMLLVSTLTKCYVCDTAKEIFRQVGHKLRDGEYGACFFNSHNDQDVVFDSIKSDAERGISDYSNLSHLKLLCARPGSRIWEVAVDGTVISTHHFKEALAVPPKKIFFLNDSFSQNDGFTTSTLVNGSYLYKEQTNSNYAEQSFNFQKLYILLSKFFLTFKNDGIYIFDPQNAKVILWNNEITNIVDVKCITDVLYVWSGYGKMYALNLVSLENFLIRLYFQKKYLDVAKIYLEFESYLLSQANNSNKLYVLQDLDEKLRPIGNLDILFDRINPLINICKENAQKLQMENSQKLKSNRYLVSSKDQINQGDLASHRNFLRPSCLNLKSRSHSVSPERLQRRGKDHRGSSSSLPDLLKERQAKECSIEDNEIIVNGSRENEAVFLEPKIDLEGACKIREILKNCSSHSKELVFNLLNQILALSETNKSGSDCNLGEVQSLPFKSYFDEKDLHLISDLFHTSLKSKILLEWLSEFRGDWLESAIKNYPEFLQKKFSSQSLELDCKLSNVLKLVSGLLEESKIIELIKAAELDCYYASLIKILDIFHDSSLFSNLDLAKVSSTPKILNIVFFLINVGQIEQCSKYSNKIDFQDMLYLMLKYEEQLGRSGKSCDLIELQCHTLFLSYIQKASEGNQLIDSCEDIVEDYIINCLENINSTATNLRNRNCICGFPYPGLQPLMPMFPEIGHALVNKVWSKNPSRCMEICGRVPYLWKYLIFVRRSEPLNTLLPLILQSGDVLELDNRSSEIDTKIFKLAIEYLTKLKSGICLNCGEKIKIENDTISWTELGLLCVKLLGVTETLNLYTEHANEISSSDLGQSFYRGLIFSSIMEKHSRGVRKNVVDLLMGKGTQESFKIAVFSEKVKKKVLGKADKYSSQNYKFDSHHWGVKTSFKSNCAVCSLPLDTKVLISEAGLIIFKCTHAFHSACLRKVNLECPICKSTTSNEIVKAK